jgi:hypothetical protein
MNADPVVVMAAGEQHGDIGVAICQPFGHEAPCAHRSLRTFAQLAAADAVPALNFDYAGMGDSADIAAGCEQLERWPRCRRTATSHRRATSLRHSTLFRARHEGEFKPTATQRRRGFAVRSAEQTHFV